ncbi:MAG TPA: sulfurtransferase TusA family protein, partial [Armatimonadetes bacterium]|nr:sulfurtransferase TusA family protein [Armatimonadota bacterium]
KSAHALCQQTRETELLYQAVVALARSLLVLRGLDPQSEEEVLAHFEQQFVAPGWVASRYRMLLQAAREYRESGAERALWEQATLVPALAERIKALYESMDANLQFQIEPEEKPALAEPEPTPIALLLDLRGVQCPLNYVRAKMALEEMEGGDLLELLLDDGEPIMNVPPSLEDDGQDVLEISKENGYYRVKVRKQV